MTENTIVSNQHNELHFSYAAEFIEDAEDLFIEAKDALFDINNWAQAAGLKGINFTLTDAHKKEVHRTAHTGDHISIEKDKVTYWLHVDIVEYDDYPDENKESFMICIKPLGSQNDNIICLSIERINTRLFAYLNYVEANAIDLIDNQSPMTENTIPILSHIEWSALLKRFISFE